MSEQALASSDIEGLDLNYPAWIDTPHGLIECAIIRISSARVRIRLAIDAPIDESFDLWLTRNGACRRACRLIGRNETILLVDFLRDPAPGRLHAYQLAC